MTGDFARMASPSESSVYREVRNMLHREAEHFFPQVDYGRD